MKNNKLEFGIIREKMRRRPWDALTAKTDPGAAGNRHGEGKSRRSVLYALAETRDRRKRQTPELPQVVLRDKSLI